MALDRAFALLLVLVGCGPGVAGSGSDDKGPTDGPSVTEPTEPTDPTDPTLTNPSGAPTWYQDIAPLMADRCGACHRDGGVGPFSMETYEEAEPWGPAIAWSIETGVMPPFYAVDSDVCDMQGIGFLDDIRLSDAEKQLVYDWVDADMPAGDPTAAAVAELRPVQDLENWDLELTIQEPFPVVGDDVYQCFRLPLPNKTDKYLTALQVLPDNDLVVHHAIVWTDPHDNSEGPAGSEGTYGCSGFPDIFPTEIAATWTPGAQPTINPAGTGMLLEPGSSLVINIHYHPTGTSTEFDQSKIRLTWSDDKPDFYTTWYLVDLPFGAFTQPGPNDENGTEFRIPAGVPDHMETVQMTFASLLFTADMTVFAITPHMHYLGTEMLVNIEHVDQGGDDQCLIHTPGFRFDFQSGYVYDVANPLDLPVIHRGDRVRVSCMYDNSVDNPYMAQHLAASGLTEPQDVYWGEETGDEMCMAIVGLIVPTEGWSPLSWF